MKCFLIFRVNYLSMATIVQYLNSSIDKICKKLRINLLILHLHKKMYILTTVPVVTLIK